MKKRTYEIVKTISNILYKKPMIYLPDKYDENVPSIFMSNHAKNYGPIMAATNFPYDVRPWAHSEVVNYDESFEYIRDTFCYDRLKLNKKTGEFLAKLIAKPVVGVVNMNNPIAIYHDGTRDISTIRMSVESLMNNENQLIFTTNDKPLAINGKINPNFDFFQGYLLIVKQLLIKNVIPNIYPVSINKSESTISIGEPISPNRSNSWKNEKVRINDYIVSEVKRGYVDPSRKDVQSDFAINLMESAAMRKI